MNDMIFINFLIIVILFQLEKSEIPGDYCSSNIKSWYDMNV